MYVLYRHGKECKGGMHCATWDRTVCMDGMTKPWATPTKTRTSMMACVLRASDGVMIEAVDHMAKEAASVFRPPHL